MKTHFKPIGEKGFLCKEVIDSYRSFECTNGHKWTETLQNRANIPEPISFPFPNSDNICPFCLSEMLSNLGRVSIREHENENYFTN